MEQKPVKLDYASPDERESRPATHRAIHAAIVAGAGLLSTLIVYATANAPGTAHGPDMFVVDMIGITVVLTVPFMVGIAVPRSNRWFKIIFGLICLAPAVGVCVSTLVNDSRLPFDRFRDYLADPVPASVTGLRFATREEMIDPELVLLFNIAKADLDRIIQGQGYVRVPVGQLRNPLDRFNDLNYLRVSDDDEFYQLVDKMDDVLTLRVNRRHMSAIFRHETSLQYRTRPAGR